LRIHAPFYMPHRVSLVQYADAVEGPRTSPPTWKAGLRRLYQRFEGRLAPVVRRPALELVEPGEGNGYHPEAPAVMRCLSEGEPESPRMPLDETIAVLETLDEVRGRWSARDFRSPGPGAASS